MLLGDLNKSTVSVLGGDEVAFAFQGSKINLSDNLDSISVGHVDLFIDIVFDGARFGEVRPIGEGLKFDFAIRIKTLRTVGLDARATEDGRHD